MTDEELTIRFRETSENSIISEFFNRYIHLVYAVCMKYMRDDGKARDFAMVVFESLDEKLLRFEVTNFKSWLLTIARNTCLMELRKKKREFLVDGNEFSAFHSMENSEEVHLKDGDEIEQLVVNSLHRLKECQRRCLELMYFQDKSYREIANITGYSLKEVKSYIQNGKRNLKGYLDTYNEKNG